MASLPSTHKKFEPKEWVTFRNNVNYKCILCEEIVPQKKSLTGRRFGILDICNHVFCIHCIQEYIKSNIEMNMVKKKFRGEELLKRSIICPQCKVYSSVVMACEKHLSDANEKKDYKKVFDQSVSNIPCPFSKKGIHHCFCESKHEWQGCVVYGCYVPVLML